MRIPARFNGPPSTGNGGWSAGAFAAAAGAQVAGPPIEVTLRVPPPLDTELTVAGGAVLDGDTLVASMTPAEGALLPVAAVDPHSAAEAAKRYAGFTHHPFPTCYVCGTQRPDGEATEVAGRKTMVNSSLYGAGGARLATARATWIATT
jgi:hypothetical protein